MIYYRSALEGLTPAQLKGFFVGWPNPPSPETHLKLLQNSDEVVLAMDDQTNRVVGFITAITDKVLSAFIPYLEVLPEYQKQGVGSELVRIMLERLQPYYSVDLICDPEMKRFYESHGMISVTGMAARRYNRQSGAE